MEKQFNILENTRKNMVKVLNTLTMEELTIIPDGFSNNVLWNAAHCLVTQQLLCYGMSGNNFTISKDLIEKYRKGTKAETTVSNSEVELIKELLISTVQEAKTFYEEGKFGSDFKSYETSYGVTLRSIEDAISFSNVHEGVHFGYILAQKKGV